MPVNPTKFDLINAYKIHKRFATKANALSHKLLWFYAAECGLKAYYLHLNNLVDAVQGDLQSRFSHKIKKLLRECYIPDFVLNEPNEGNGNYAVKEFHEYMRYGAPIPNNLEISQLEYLKSIVAELENHL
jgi:hypothetical protein